MYLAFQLMQGTAMASQKLHDYLGSPLEDASEGRHTYTFFFWLISLRCLRPNS